jgi:hypothetical protein
MKACRFAWLLLVLLVLQTANGGRSERLIREVMEKGSSLMKEGSMMMRMGATRWVTKALPPTVLEDIAREYGKSPVREMSELKSDVGPSGLLEAAADGTRCPAPLRADGVSPRRPKLHADARGCERLRH